MKYKKDFKNFASAYQKKEKEILILTSDGIKRRSMVCIEILFSLF
jgi:hypothetical protein